MQNIKNKFKELYPQLPFPDENEQRGTVELGADNIKYAFGKDEKGDAYLDTYSSHRMGSAHLRITHSGEVEVLDTYQEGFSYDAEIPGDEQRAEKEHRKHNERVGKLLLEKFY